MGIIIKLKRNEKTLKQFLLSTGIIFSVIILCFVFTGCETKIIEVRLIDYENKICMDKQNTTIKCFGCSENNFQYCKVSTTAIDLKLACWC